MKVSRGTSDTYTIATYLPWHGNQGEYMGQLLLANEVSQAHEA